MTMKETFSDALQRRVLVCDGAMGTMLYAKGIFINRCFDELNLSAPELVEEVHREYLEVGVDILETNTFGANRLKLTPHGCGEKVNEINRRGVQIARKVAGESAFVAGSIGPTGKQVGASGELSEAEAKAVFAEQVAGLLDGGVDVFMLETFSNLDELHQAVLAVQEACDLPIVAQMTIGDDGNSPMGVPPAEIARKIASWNVAAAGLNCRVGPRTMLESITAMSAACRLPLSAQPNAGIPEFFEGRFLYMATPEYLAEYAKRFIKAGVKIVGGCCGTTPKHLKAIRSAVRAIETQTSRVVVQASREEVFEFTPPPAPQRSTFAQKLLSGKFVSSVEISPPKGTDVTNALNTAKKLQDAGVDAANVPDGPRASGRMCPLALTALIKQQLTIEPIVHFCSRDRNILGVQADLLGAHALGVHNIMFITGDPPKLGNYPDATAVFDIDSIGLVQVGWQMNHGRDIANMPLKSHTSFFMGVGADPGATDIDREVARFEEKIAHGAEFVFTQPVYDVRFLERFLKRVSKLTIPILVGILPLCSYRNAEFLHNEVPGMSIPDHIRERMKLAGSGEIGQAEGVKIAQEALKDSKSMVQGVYIIPPLGKHDLALRVLDIL